MYIPTQTVSICLVALLLHAFLGARKYELALSLPASRDTAVWNFFTPLLVHINAIHLFGNLAFFLICGALVELVHGAIALQLLFWVTGVTGTLAEAASGNCKKCMYLGMSPSVLGMTGVYIAHLSFNWKQTKSKYIFLTALSIYLIYSITYYIYNPPSDNVKVAHVSHAFGILQGLFAGWVGARNIIAHPWEWILRLTGLGFATVTLVIINSFINVQSAS